jgi:hypothetical protein
MRLAWHILQKDFIRLKWILMLWGVVLGAGLVLTTIQAGLDSETYFPFYIAAKVVVSGLVPLIAFGLVMGLMHDDSVAEIDAFWITRPISGGELLVAKGVAWLLLGLIPVVVAVPFWLSHDYGWNQAFVAAQHTLRMHIIVAVGALPFAVISANGSRFVMNVLVGTGALLLLALLIRIGDSSANQSDAPALLQTKSWLVAWLWFAASFTMALNQFLRRRIRQSLAVLIVAVIAGLVVVKCWSWKLAFVLQQTPPPLTAAELQIKRGAPAFPAKINDEMKRVVVIAEVPLREGASASRDGVTLKVQAVSLDYTDQLQVSFSEATADLSEGFRDLLPGALPREGPPEYYFINNRSDGRAFLVKPTRLPNELTVATLCFSHLNISARPATWFSGAPPNLAQWLKDAVLVKVVADDFTPAPSMAAATPISP